MVSLTHHVGHRRLSGASNRSSVDETRSDGAEDDTLIVEPDQGNVLSHIISQLRPGADLSRVVLPTFILEPRSMLERITNFMAHPETLLPMVEIDDPLERFVSVVKFYLSGWHIKPPGVKKPLNPILGETYTCYWDFPDNTKGYYIAEQTSHHPPKSSYFYMAPEHHIRIDGCLKPRSKFLGNSAASMMEGIAILRFLNRGEGPKGESYILTQPNMYARGILFGKMKYELGDHSFVRCPELGYSADIEFKVKGYFGGSYNAIGGFIKNDKTGEVLYELSGMWSGEMWLKDVTTGKKELLFNATRAKHTAPLVRPMEEQEDRESQKLWYTTAQAVIARNHELATDEKTKIEDMQREEAARRAQDGVEWLPRLFRAVKAGPGGSEEGEGDLDWILNANIDGSTPAKQTEQILAITPILPGQQPTQKNRIPKRSESLLSIRSKAHSITNENQIPLTKQPSLTEEPADLIDFGQTNHSNVAAPALSSAPSAAPLQDQIPNQDKPLPAPTPAAAPAIQLAPSDLYLAQTVNGGEKQKELEQELRNTGVSPPPKGEALTNLEKDLKRDLPVTTEKEKDGKSTAAAVGVGKEGEKKTVPALKRENTDDSDDDDFVDAED